MFIKCITCMQYKMHIPVLVYFTCVNVKCRDMGEVWDRAKYGMIMFSHSNKFESF